MEGRGALRKKIDGCPLAVRSEEMWKVAMANCVVRLVTCTDSQGRVSAGQDIIRSRCTCGASGEANTEVEEGQAGPYIHPELTSGEAATMTPAVAIIRPAWHCGWGPCGRPLELYSRGRQRCTDPWSCARATARHARARRLETCTWHQSRLTFKCVEHRLDGTHNHRPQGPLKTEAVTRPEQSLTVLGSVGHESRISLDLELFRRCAPPVPSSRRRSQKVETNNPAHLGHFRRLMRLGWVL